MQRPGTDKERFPLEHMARLLAQEINLNDMLSSLGSQLADAVNAEHTSVWLIDAADGALVNRVTDTQEIQARRIPLGTGLVGVAADEARCVRVDDVQMDARWNREFDAHSGIQTRSVLSVPILAEGQVLGVIQAINACSGCFSLADEQRLGALALQIGQVMATTALQALPDTPGVHLSGPYNNIVGESQALQGVYSIVERAAPTDAPVLLTGETGTGKGLFARALHFNSSRRDKPFVSLDCTNLPPTLIESTLFGHERGSFTGANQRRIGKVESASGGTLFVDEFGELPLPVQGKLLRLIQEQAFERVGGNNTITADVRFIFATHRDLNALIEAGQFRADLYYRARVIEIELPALRARGRDEIERLVHHFTRKFSRKYSRVIHSIADDAMTALVRHTWPGNVRELENALERAIVLAQTGCLEVSDFTFLPSRNAEASPDLSQEGFIAADASLLLDDAIVAHARRVLALCKGNRSKAARTLGVSRNRLARILKSAE